MARLPASALGADGTVLALDAQDRLERVPVTLFRRQGNEVLVRAAAVAGRAIVAESGPALGPGLKVRRLSPPPAATEEGAMLSLSPDRRARLRAHVETDPTLSESQRARLLAELAQERVPARTVARLEGRIGG